jgi:rhodanese-related sulfurtransferase
MRRHVLLALAGLGLALASLTATAQQVEVTKEKATKLGKYLTARQAYDLVRADRSKVLFIDTRTRGELAFVGMTLEVDAQIPYAEVNEFWEWDDKSGRFKLDLNLRFGQDVTGKLAAKGLTKADAVILICRSGDRSARAVNLLADMGFTNAYSVIDGFEGDLSAEGRRSVNGWKNAGLPWTYKLEKGKVYLPTRQ